MSTRLCRPVPLTRKRQNQFVCTQSGSGVLFLLIFTVKTRPRDGQFQAADVPDVSVDQRNPAQPVHHFPGSQPCVHHQGLRSAGGNLRAIFISIGTDLTSGFSHCIQIDPSDNLPQMVCKSCAVKLIRVRENVSLFVESDRKLREKLQGGTVAAGEVHKLGQDRRKYGRKPADEDDQRWEARPKDGDVLKKEIPKEAKDLGGADVG